MPIKVSWDNEEKTAVLHVYDGQWDLDDFYAAVHSTNELMSSVHHKVDMLLDIRGSKSLPAGFIGAIRSLSSRPHANTGLMVIIGGSRLMRAFNDMFAKLYPAKAKERPSYMAGSYEEAQAILARIRQSEHN